MDKRKLSRREVLAGLAVTGSSGALVGSGTGALFSDEEVFTNNSITGSKTTAGVVNFNLENPSLGSIDDSVTFTVSVPDTEKQRENPAFVCVQTKDCPEDAVLEPEDGKDSPDSLRVQLVLECDQGKKRTLTGSLREVLDVLNRGLLLSCDDDPCLDPGGSELTLTLNVLDNLGIEEYNFEFALDFLAEQCRANEPTVPSEPGLSDLLGTCPTDEECPPTGNKDISFIAFCCKDGGDPNPEIKTHRPGNDGFTSIIWETEKDVDYVVVFGGNYWTIYDYHSEEITGGIATTGGDTAANFYGPTSSLDDNGFGGCQNGNAQSCPCQVAEDIVGSGNSFTGTSVKFEYCEGKNDDELKFRPEDECKDKNGNGGGPNDD